MPYIFNCNNENNIKATLRWLYDRYLEINSSAPAYDVKDKSAALLYYPYELPAHQPTTVFPQSASMLIDNIDGFYAIRSRSQDQNDVLIALINRKRDAYIKAIRAFTGQGGGCVSIDTTVNFRIALVQRHILVDMMSRGSINTIIAIHDQFLDTKSLSWHLQLNPDPAETNIMLANENNVTTFIIIGQNGSWLYDDQHATCDNTKEALRIIKCGFNTNFKIVMALEMDSKPVATGTTTDLTITDA